MTDMTGEIARASHTRRNRFEYRAYFAIVYLLALPIATLRCLMPRALEQAQGPLAEARRMTETVIPYIFMH